MESGRKRRLEHYLMNADRFMWGLGPGNQQENYRWLESKKLKFTRARYGLVTQQLINYPGIEEILKVIVIPSVEEQFPSTTLEMLREHWMRGEHPELSKLNKLELGDRKNPGPDRAFLWRPFIEIDTQFHYVERWGELTGTWFEEIEPYLSMEDKNK